MFIALKKVGTRHFDSTPVTVTDPCYSKDVWCTIQDIHIRPGDYHCIKGITRNYYKDRTTGKRRWYNVIAKCQILHTDYTDTTSLKREEIGSIGVDAGIAGFYQNKPDYTREKWNDFCNAMGNKDVYIDKYGFCTSSGYGDGGYYVYTYKDKTEDIVGLEIVFI